MPRCEICKYKKTSLFHKIKKYNYFCCSRCLTLFLFPKPTQRQTTHYYTKNFIYSAGEVNEKTIQTRGKLILKKLKELNPAGNSLLDIGSGFGYFLEQAKRIGFNVVGIEPSKSIYSISIKRLIEINIKNTNFENYYKKNKNKKFDYITIIHTIEHVIDPQKILSKAIKLLNPQGILYIETPNLDSYLFNIEKYNYTFLTPPDHIWLFSPKSFRYMLRNVKNAEAIKTSTYSHPEHFMGILKRILKKYNKKQKILTQENKDAIKTHTPLQSIKFLKYLIFDKLLSPLFVNFLNLGNYGSILELYIRKK